MPVPVLTEIVLTKDNGFVTKDNRTPVDILGGDAQLGRVAKNNPPDIKAGIEDAIQRVYAAQLPVGTNGYIIHVATPLGEVSDRIPVNEREVMVAFTAVQYQERRV